MNRYVWAPCALVLALLVVGCAEQQGAPNSRQSAEAATLTAIDLKVVEVASQIADFKRYRDTSTGWAAEVHPGDRRNTREVGDDLAKLSSMQSLIADAPNSDKVGELRGEIRGLMLEECTLLLRKARGEQDIWALGKFIQHAQNLEVSLDTDFGVNRLGFTPLASSGA